MKEEEAKTKWCPMVRLEGDYADELGANRSKSGRIPDFILMQYTGLKDKNGTPIYEGDIVRQTDINSDMPNAVIEWQSDGAWFALKFKKGGAWSMHHAHMKVIGNIYENPELLNGMSEWVSVIERLPVLAKPYWVWTESIGQTEALFSEDGNWIGLDETCCYTDTPRYIYLDVTHWMPLPNPPEKEDD